MNAPDLILVHIQKPDMLNELKVLKFDYYLDYECTSNSCNNYFLFLKTIKHFVQMNAKC